MKFILPDLGKLQELHADLDDTIDKIDGIVEFVEKYSGFFPQLHDFAAKLDQELHTAKAFLDHVPML